jgi:hypothetical protein
MMASAPFLAHNTVIINYIYFFTLPTLLLFFKIYKEVAAKTENAILLRFSSKKKRIDNALSYYCL